MPQITIRADVELMQRVKAAAVGLGRSMNDYVTAVLDAATNPEFAGAEIDRLRERLGRAGLLVVPLPRAGTRPSASAVAAAGHRAATGRSVADFVSDGR